MVVVSDTSVLIDLERASLLTASFRLRCRFAVPDVLYQRELRAFGSEDLRKRGLSVEVLDSAGVTLAMGYRRSCPGLSLPDTFALALAKSNGWTLLTGDAELRQVAKKRSRRVPRSPLAARSHARGGDIEPARVARRPSHHEQPSSLPTATERGAEAAQGMDGLVADRCLTSFGGRYRKSARVGIG